MSGNRRAMRPDLVPGNTFPDLRLPEHTGRELSLSKIAAGMPLVLCFLRGWWCPKEQVRIRQLVSLQEELQREYGRIAVVTTCTTSRTRRVARPCQAAARIVTV